MLVYLGRENPTHSDTGENTDSDGERQEQFIKSSLLLTRRKKGKALLSFFAPANQEIVKEQAELAEGAAYVFPHSLWHSLSFSIPFGDEGGSFYILKAGVVCRAFSDDSSGEEGDCAESSSGSSDSPVEG